jgi:hypothetical protein
LLSSISISEREEWPEGICGCHPLRKAALERQYGTAGRGKKPEASISGGSRGKPVPETRLSLERILERLDVQPFFMTVLFGGPCRRFAPILFNQVDGEN